LKRSCRAGGEPGSQASGALYGSTHDTLSVTTMRSIVFQLGAHLDDVVKLAQFLEADDLRLGTVGVEYSAIKRLLLRPRIV
jgi:hypothetical protein